jgi:hypothetical protein
MVKPSSHELIIVKELGINATTTTPTPTKPTPSRTSKSGVS